MWGGCRGPALDRIRARSSDPRPWTGAKRGTPGQHGPRRRPAEAWGAADASPPCAGLWPLVARGRSRFFGRAVRRSDAARSASKAGPLFQRARPKRAAFKWPAAAAAAATDGNRRGRPRPGSAAGGREGRGLATRAAKRRGQPARRAEARYRARRAGCTYAANRRGPCPGAAVKAAALAALALALIAARARATASGRQRRRQPPLIKAAVAARPLLSRAAGTADREARRQPRTGWRGRGARVAGNAGGGGCCFAAGGAPRTWC